MKIRHIVFSLLPAIVVADVPTTVPDDEPLMPPLPEELLSPQGGETGLPASARPVVSYRAPKDEEQTWLKLFYIKPTDEWPDIFRRMAAASHEKDMQMCHGYALWLKGQNLVHLRYDDDLSLSGIHADGHAYGVLYVEFNPYGIRVSPMEGFDLTGKNGGVCWQDAASKLWSWAEADKFWAELPKLLKADSKTRVTSAQDTAVKREVATKGQRMVVFWAPKGYPAKSWWSSFLRLHEQAGANRFSLVAAEGLKLWTDVVVPSVKPSGATPAPVTPAPSATPEPPPSAPTPVTAAPPPNVKGGKETLPPAAAPVPTPQAAPTPAAPAATAAPASPPPAPAAPQSAGKPVPPVAPAQKPAANEKPEKEHTVPEVLHPASGTPKDVAPDASVRPWALENGIAPSPSKSAKKKSPVTPPAAPAPATPAPSAPAATPAPADPPAQAPPAAPEPAPQAAPAPAPAPAEPKPASGARSLDAVDAIVLP